MPSHSIITSVRARQVFTWRNHPGIETTVTTRNEGVGVAQVTAGKSVGDYEVQFAYDGGSRWEGRGVQGAVDNVNNLIAPAIVGMDASQQLEIDHVMLTLDGTPDRSKLGGNALASVSAAVLKAGADSLGLPLYQHIGGANAVVLPVPGEGLFRYYRSAQDFEDKLARLAEARALAEGFDDPYFLHETDVATSYVLLARSIYRLGTLLATEDPLKPSNQTRLHEMLAELREAGAMNAEAIRTWRAGIVPEPWHYRVHDAIRASEETVANIGGIVEGRYLY